MILELKRKGRLIAETVPIDNSPMYAGTILVHELAVRCPLFEGEALSVNFTDKNGNPITYAKLLIDRRTYTDGHSQVQGLEWHTIIPNKVMAVGEKKACIAILDLYQPSQDINAGQQYRVISSADVPFAVYPSGVNTDFEPVDESLSEKLQRDVGRIIGLTQSPDNSEAGLVGNPQVSIKPDGRLKFSNLKGEPGVNATVQWGVDTSSPISTLQWQEK